MADDAALWFLLAAGIALIWCGCLMTGRKKQLQLDRHGFDHEFDRVA
jgi:hypothetical protein